MNTYLKKTLSILLALLMLVTMVPVTSLATGDGETKVIYLDKNNISFGAYVDFYDAQDNKLDITEVAMGGDIYACEFTVEPVRYFHIDGIGGAFEGDISDLPTIPENADTLSMSFGNWYCSHQLKTSGNQTCKGFNCEICNEFYGEADLLAHNWVEGICTICDEVCPHVSYTESLCDACGAACPHDSYTDSICDSCGAGCPHDTYSDYECGKCGKEALFVSLKLGDSSGKGWEKAKLQIYKDGVFFSEYALESGHTFTEKFELDRSSEYSFRWREDNGADKFSVVIKINGIEVFNDGNGSFATVPDGDEIYNTKEFCFCVDENEDHKCDFCDEISFECSDEDSDNFCDICEKYIEPEVKITLNAVKVYTEPEESSFEYSDNEAVDRLTDGNNETKHCVSFESQKFHYKVDAYNIILKTADGSEIVPSKYEFVTANDFPNRDPKSWKLYGSVDGEKWTLIEERIDAKITRERNSAQSFGISDSEKAYSYFKFEILDLRSNDHNDWAVALQLSEISMYEAHTHEWEDGICTICRKECAHKNIVDKVCAVCGVDCPHDSYTDSICDACGCVCTHKNVTDFECDDCGLKVNLFTINMNDSFGDGWNGAEIVIYSVVDEEYVEISTITLEDGKSGTSEIYLPETGVFAFKWLSGNYPSECSFTVECNGKIVCEVESGSSVDNEFIFYLSCNHEFENGVCKHCDGVCGVNVEHKVVNSVCTECNKYIYAITHQPTVEEPYVELNDNTDASYQWYAENCGNTTVDDVLAAPFNFNDAGGLATYDSETGWKGYLRSSYVLNDFNFFTLYLDRGETITFEPDASISGITIRFLNDSNIEKYITCDGEKAYSYIAECSGMYYVLGLSPETEAYLKAYIDRKKLDGETSATLQNPLYGEKCYCVVTFADGTTEKSASADFAYKITHQPTENEPYVELNNADGASYQWYEGGGRSFEITDKTAKAIVSAEDVGEYEETLQDKSSYSEEEGWEPAYYTVGTVSFNYYFVVDLRAGETVNLELSNGVYSLELVDLKTEEKHTLYCDYEKNVTFTVEKNMTALLHCLGEYTKIKATVTGGESRLLVEETSDELINIEFGNKYICEVTYADGSIRFSDVVDHPYKITHQPTAGAPYVTLNNDEDATYQWYEVHEKRENVTLDNAVVFTPETDDEEDEDFNASESSYNAEDGYWTPIYYTYSYEDETWYEARYFQVHLNKGDKIEFEFESTENLRGFYVGKLIGTSDWIVDFKNNKGSFIASSDGDYLVTSTEYIGLSAPSRVKATIYSVENKLLDGNTERALKNPVVGTTYMCEVTAKDGSVIESDSFVYKKAISSQPAEDDMSVSVNEGNATYQWYKVTGEKYEITDKEATAFDLEDIYSSMAPSETDASTFGASAMSSVLPDPAEYSADNGWIPCYMASDGKYVMYYFIVEIENGQKLDFEFSDDVTELLVVEDLLSMYSKRIEVNDKNASYTADKDGNLIVGAISDSLITLRAYIDNREYEVIDGETASSFIPEEAGAYACEVTFEDGTKEKSETVKVEHYLDDAQTCKGYLCICGEYHGEKAEHIYKVFNIVTPPSCNSDGLERACCEYGCGDESERALPATNHKDTLVKVGAKAPTCKEIGWDAYEYCTACTYSTYKEKIKADHKDANGDYICDYGCGYEFAKPVTPEEPTTKPAEDTTKPSEEPTTKPDEDVTKPSTEPTTKPAEDVTKPSTEPTTKPAEDTTKPSTDSTTKPVEDTTKPSIEPTTKPAEDVTKPSTESTTKPVEDTTKPSTDEHKHTVVVIPAVNATYTKTGLTEGKKCSECGEIIVAQKKVARKKLKKVTSLKAKKSTSTSVTLSWKKVTGADSYKVYYSTDGKKWKSVKVKKNSATIKKLKSGTQYRFKVRAFAGKYYGEASKIVKKTTKVKKPTLSSVKSSKKNTATVSWKKVTNASGYVVEYSTSKKFTKKTTKTVKIKKGKTVKTTLKKLKSGKKYYVRVKAYKTVNKKAVYGSYSSVKTVKVK